MYSHWVLCTHPIINYGKFHSHVPVAAIVTVRPPTVLNLAAKNESRTGK